MVRVVRTNAISNSLNCSSLIQQSSQGLHSELLAPKAQGTLRSVEATSPSGQRATSPWQARRLSVRKLYKNTDYMLHIAESPCN